MTQAEAGHLVAKLFAAFPFHRDNDELTAAVYLEQFQKLLPDPQVALQTVNDLIGTKRYLPTVAEVREQYDRVREARRTFVRALNEPAPTEEEKAENLRQIRALVKRLNRRKVA